MCNGSICGFDYFVFYIRLNPPALFQTLNKTRIASETRVSGSE